MSMVRAAQDNDRPSAVVAVPRPRCPEPGPAADGAAGGPNLSRAYVRAVLTGSPRPRRALRLRVVRAGEPSPARPRPGTAHPAARPGLAPGRPGQGSVPASPAAARTAQSAVPAAQTPARMAPPRSVPPRSAQARSAQARSAQARSAQARSAQPSGLRLTHRGRLVLSGFALALILALVTVLWMGLAGGAQAASDRTHSGSVYQGMHQVTVLPGETLWTIAEHAEPSADPRLVIQQIMQINAISTTDLQPGQQLWVPRA